MMRTKKTINLCLVLWVTHCAEMGGLADLLMTMTEAWYELSGRKNVGKAE